MKILFVHHNYPGQFRNFAPELVNLGYEVIALRMGNTNNKPMIPSSINGVKIHQWLPKMGTTLSAHPWVHDIETKLIRAEAAASACEKLKQRGWYPDLIIGHPGWGEMLFMRHIWDNVPEIHFLEFNYNSSGFDVGFDPEFSHFDWRENARVSTKTSLNLLNLEAMNAGISPTFFQASTYPNWAQARINVIHDGINTDIVKPNSSVKIKLAGRAKELSAHDQVITFVNRNLEPYRGYHRLMRALPEIQKRCPNSIVVIVGGDGVSYGAAPPQGKTWKQIFLDEVINELDMSRIIFTGSVAYHDYLKILQLSLCHIYFTYPFVLGWSCLEAMAVGALVVGSNTAPVKEVIEHGRNGLLVDFFDQESLIDTVCDAIHNPRKYQPLRIEARNTAVSCYDIKSICLPKQIDLVKSLLD